MNKKFVILVISILLFATVSSVAVTTNISEDYFEGFTIGANDDPWAMKGHDSQRTSFSTSDAPDTNDTLWEQELGQRVKHSPAVVDERIYVGTNGPPQAAKFLCYDISGFKIWEFEEIADTSSPAVYDEKVYFVNYAWRLYCLDAEGNGDGTTDELWNFSFQNFVCSSPAVADGKVYIGSNDYKIYCLDAEDGTEIWNYTTGGQVQSSPAVYDGKVYVGSNDQDVYCFYAENGTKLWNYTTGGPIGSTFGESIIVYEDSVYASSDKLYCLNADTGIEIWSNSTVIGHIAVGYGNLYIGSSSGRVHCVNATDGTLIWNIKPGPSSLQIHTPSVADGKVHVSSLFDMIYCLDAYGNGDGTTDVIWEYNVDDILFGSPVIAFNKLFVGTAAPTGQNGTLYCFGTNHPPEAPDQPEGPTYGYVGVEYTYSVDPVTDPDGDDVFYLFDWGDGTNTGWISTPNASKTWDEDGYFEVKVKVKDIYDAENESEPLEVTIVDLEIKEIRGGLGITAVIENIGETTTASDEEWSITIDGGFIIIPRESSGTIETLTAGESEEIVMLVLGVGFGLLTDMPTITVTVGNEETTTNARIIGPLVITDSK